MGGKGDIDISITGGAEPRDDYARVSDALPLEWATFEDGAGEVELMEFGNWVNDGGPPWYYPFTVLTLSDYDYFGFSLYLFFQTEVSSIGALAADGDYYLDKTNDRVYIFGYLGGAPTADGYLHACADQFIVIGGGPLEMPEQGYPPGEVGIRKIGDLHNGVLKFTGIKNILLHALGSKVHAFGEGSKNDADWDQGETDRLGFFYSDDGGETWTWSNQWLYRQPITWRQFPGPDQIIDANEYDIPLDKTPINVGNATSYLTQTGPYGFMPMSADGTLMIYGVLGSSNETFFFTPDGGVNWRKAAHTHTYTYKDSYDLPTPGNRFEPQGMCRDASVIVNPSPTTGKAWVFYVLDRRQAPNNLITKIDLAASKVEIPPLFLAFWGYLPGSDASFASDGSARTIQASGSVFTGRPWWITSTYDTVAGKTWLHVMTKHTNGFIYYYRSDDEGVSWSGVPFQSTHDPNYVASGGNNEQRGLRSAYTANLLISPNCQDLWMVVTYGEQNGPFTDYGSNHIYRSLDHGVTWDKLSAGISGDHPFAKGMTRGSGGFLNSQSPGAIQLMFINDSYDEFILKRSKWYFEEFTYWRVNRTGSHAAAIEEATDISIDERFYFNFFHSGGGGPIWGAGNLGTELACGYASGNKGWQVLDQYHFMAPNRADFSDSFGGYNCTNSWHANGALLNPYTRGGVAEITIAPSDAVFYDICSDAGFIIRAQHVNELRQKLQQLNAVVQARGTKPTSFDIDVSAVPTVQEDKTPVQFFHFGNLRTEFETKIRPITAVDPGGSWVYTDGGVDLTDAEYDMPTPIADGPDGVSIRTLLGMRKIIQSLYLNGWFCACYSYCPCQTDIVISGGGSKK